MSTENRQVCFYYSNRITLFLKDNLNKRKFFTRSDAVVGDDDNKIGNKNDKQQSEFGKKNFSKSLQRGLSFYFLNKF
jgi:hypothetical protein